MLRTRRDRLRRAGLGSAALLVGVVVTALMVPIAHSAAPSGWNIVPSVNTSAQASNLLLGSTCTSASSCWAVGGVIPDLNSNQAKPTAMAQRWNGSVWSSGPDAVPAGSTLSLLWDVTCVSSSDCWAVGAEESTGDGAPSPLIEQWDGSTWAAVHVPSMAGILFSVTCTGPSSCWAAGTTLTDDSQSDPLNGFIDHWDGSSWTKAPTAPSGQTYDQFNSVTCSGPTDCWAVGFAGPNQQNNNFLPNVAPNVAGDQALVERWDGADWTKVSVPGATDPNGTYLSSVTCAASTECWTVGATMGADGNPSTTLIERWNGTAWSAVSSPSPAGPHDLLTDVTCLGLSSCWAVGASGTGTGNHGNFQPNPFIEEWNGSAWSLDPSPDVTAFGYLDTVSCVRSDGCIAAGFAATNFNGNLTLRTLAEQLSLPAVGNQGILLAGSDGAISALGTATSHGSMSGSHLNAPIVGMAATPDGGGYWLVASDGGIFSFGDATFDGSMGGSHLNAPIVGMAATPDGGGYWLVASDGGIFSFGDATFDGSMGGSHLNAPIVGMAATPDGGGYWLVASDGGIFSFGDAGFDGSMGGAPLGAPITGMAATPDGGGYWLVAADGGVFSLGDAGFYGSVPGQGITAPSPIDDVTVTPTGRGYWLVGQDGSVYTYGDATFLGSLAGVGVAAPIVAAVSAP